MWNQLKFSIFLEHYSKDQCPSYAWSENFTCGNHKFSDKADTIYDFHMSRNIKMKSRNACSYMKSSNEICENIRNLRRMILFTKILFYSCFWPSVFFSLLYYFFLSDSFLYFIFLLLHIQNCFSLNHHLPYLQINSLFIQQILWRDFVCLNSAYSLYSFSRCCYGFSNENNYNSENTKIHLQAVAQSEFCFGESWTEQKSIEIHVIYKN